MGVQPIPWVGGDLLTTHTHNALNMYTQHTHHVHCTHNEHTRLSIICTTLTQQDFQAHIMLTPCTHNEHTKLSII